MQCRKPRRRVCRFVFTPSSLRSGILVDLVADRLHKIARDCDLRPTGQHQFIRPVVYGSELLEEAISELESRIWGRASRRTIMEPVP
jgi:hypothetical protein